MENSFKLRISLFLTALVVPLLVLCYSYHLKGASIFYPNLQNNDAGEYALIAENLVNNHSFSLSQSNPHNPDFSRTPIFPFFLAFGFWITGNFLLSILLNIAIGALTVIVVFEIAFIILEKKRLAFISALIFTLLPYRIYISTLTLADTLFVFIFSLFSYVFLKILKKEININFTNIFLSGALLGLATLTRPISQFFVFIPVLCLLLMSLELKKRLYMAAVMVFSFILILSPWLYRNYIHSDNLFLSSIGNYHLFISYVAPWKAFEENVSREQVRQEMAESVEKQYGVNPLEDIKVSNILGDWAKKEILTHPLSYGLFHLSTLPIYFLNNDTILTLREAFNFNLPDIYMASKILSGNFKELFSLLFSAGTFLILLFATYLFLALKSILGIAGAFAYLKKSFAVAIFSIFTIFYFPLIVGPEGNARFRLPIEPCLIIFGILVIVRIGHFIKDHKMIKSR